MRRVEYEDKDTGNTETLIATDQSMEQKYGATLQNALEEGFAASDGVRGITAATGGKVKHAEEGDTSRPEAKTDSIEEENPGLADN